MNDSPHRAIIVLGAAEPAEATLVEAEQYDEVFVIARAVPDASDRWVIDGDRAAAAARTRLVSTLMRLRAHGVRALGAIGDQNATAARNDARALFPGADTVLA
jgi:hypothetical protein